MEDHILSQSRKSIKKRSLEDENKYRNREKLLIISVISGKGGSGKSTIAANMAYYLSTLKKKVLLLDLDFGCCNLHYSFGVYPPYSLYDHMHRNKSFEDIRYSLCENLWLVTTEQGKVELTNLSCDKMDDIISIVKQESQNYDYVCIDLSGGIHESVLRFAQSSDRVLVVITSDVSAVTDGYHVIKNVLKRGFHPADMFILVNQTTKEKKASGTYSRINSVLKTNMGKVIRYAGNVKYSENLQVASAQRKIFMGLYPKTEAAKQIARASLLLTAIHNRRRK